MPEIIKIIRELRLEMLKVVMLESFLDAVLAFLASFMLLSLFNFYPAASILFGVGSLIFFIWKRLAEFRLRIVEDRNPVIKEMLRTAADNAHQDNFVLRALNTELVKKMRYVTTSSMMKLNKIIYKLTGIAVFSLLIIYISTTNLLLYDLGNLLNPDFNPNAQEGSLADILGDKADIPKIGNNPVDIKLNPLSYEININKIEEAKPKQFKSDFPLDVYAVQEKSYEENIPREQQIIVKNYFASLKS